jgi:hypothetical protein
VEALFIAPWLVAAARTVRARLVPATA